MMARIFLRRRRPVERSMLGLVALLLGSAEARAQRDVPCKGCVLELPAGASEPLPLLVLLHGDEGNPSVVLPRWSKAARTRGFALLALMCPRDQGCKDGSWWRWAGDPGWIEQQVQAVGQRARIDPRRVFVSGWSGGASYLGLVAPQLRGFAAVNLSGGGLPPRSDACPACQPPVYFLVGDGNPLHHLAVASRDAFTRCGARVEWSLLRGKDHGGELAALDSRRAEQILAWFEQNAACAPAAPASSSSAPEPPPAPSAPPAPAATAPAAPSAAPPPQPAPASAPRPPGACGCGAAGGGGPGAWWALAALGGLVARGSRRACRAGQAGEHRGP